MEGTKIRLSPEESELVENAGWILTKNRIIQKAIGLFSTLQPRLEAVISTYPLFPHEISSSTPKISRGENYQGLPWVILDYPRYFDKDNVFAIRSFFWWGHFFSCTLHLSGSYQSRYIENIINSFEELKASGYYLCVNEDQWQHHFGDINYKPVHEFSPGAFENVCRGPFLKLAKNFPLKEWDDMENKLPGVVDQLLHMLNDQLPRR